jgi:hypothetical protein
MKKQKLTIKATTIYKYVQLWNGIFNLTSKELDILSTFLELPLEIAFTTKGKKLTAKALNLKDFNTLNNYIKKFKDKGVIKKVDNEYILNKLLDPTTELVEINFIHG